MQKNTRDYEESGLPNQKDTPQDKDIPDHLREIFKKNSEAVKNIITANDPDKDKDSISNTSPLGFWNLQRQLDQQQTTQEKGIPRAPFDSDRHLFAPEEFRKSIESLLKGVPVSSDDTYHFFLKRLYENDRKTLEILAASDIATLAETQCLTAILCEKSTGFTEDDGTAIRGFIGKDINKGGFGTITNVAFVRKNHTGFTIGALKKANRCGNEKASPAQKAYQKEIATVRAQIEWNNPNIIRAISIGPEHIIYETGESISLREALNRQEPSKTTGFLSQMKNAVDDYRKRDFFHGDIKPANILIIGKTAKLIDNAIHKEEDINEGEYFMTPLYSISPYSMVRAEGVLRTKKGLSRKESKTRLTKAVDTYSLLVILHEILTHESIRKIKGITPQDYYALFTYANRFKEYRQQFNISAWRVCPQKMPVFPKTSVPELNKIALLSKRSQNPIELSRPDYYEKFWKAIAGLERILNA